MSLLGVSVLLLLLLAAVCEAQYYGDFTPAPDYDSDYNATFEYSFYSNASSEDLDSFSKRFMDEDEDEQVGEEEDTEGQQGQEEVTVTPATTSGVTVRGGVHGRSAATPSVSLEIRTLVWTLMILMVLNLQQL